MVILIESAKGAAMKLSKDDYFNLVEDDIIYKTHKEQIDVFIKEALETEEKKKEREKTGKENNITAEVLTESEIDELLTAIPYGEMASLRCPKEIEISDTEYEQLKQHSIWLNIFEGPQDFSASAFESFRDKYNNAEEKIYKLKKVIAGLMDNNVERIDKKIKIFLDILL